MKNRKLLLIVSLVLALTMSLGGTMAYLQDTDADINVMTLGSVTITQNEHQRAKNADGTYKIATIDDVTSYVLEVYENDKPLLPTTELGADGKPYNNGAGDYDDTTVRMSQIGSHGGMQVFESENAADKFVTVTNTGKSDAYVRTIVAIEVGSTDGGLIGTSYHSTWTKNEKGIFTIEGNNYYVTEYVYAGAAGVRHDNGVLPAGDTTYPSLSQVYLYAVATNEDMTKLDGNKNDKLDILVLSQAIQADGFANATAALEAGFGKVEDNVTDWFTREKLEADIGTPGEKWPSNDTPVVDAIKVGTLGELKEAFAEGGYVLLTEDIELEKITAIEPGKEVYLDLNGKTITVDQDTTSNTLIWVQEGAKLVIDGNGTIDLEDVSTMAIFCPYGELVIENGTFTRNEITADEVTDKTTGLFMGAKNSGCNVTINGGYFDPGYYDENAADIEDILAGTVPFTETEDDIAKQGLPGDKNVVRVAVKDNVSVVLNHSGYGSFKVYGGTFVGANPAWGDEGCMLPTTPNYLRPWSYYQGALLDGQTFDENGIVLPEGYTITNEKLADGRPAYTVTYSK